MAQRPDVGRTGTVRVSFVCQRCNQPLQLDDSFRALNDKIQAELTVPLRSANQAGDDVTDTKLQMLEPSPAAQMHRIIPPAYCSITNDFTIVGDAKSTEVHSFGVVAQLYDILSGQSDIDHPLCEECTDSLLDQLDSQLKLTEDEFKDYREYLDKLNAEQDTTDEAQLDEELQKLKMEEAALHQQLESAECERDEIRQQIDAEKVKAKQLDAAEAKYYRDYHEHKRQLLDYEDSQRSVENQLKYAKAQLDKLKKTNVFNATFHIWHSGHFGTINGFRLGRLPSVPVEWNEINAAWGQTALLLSSLANRMGLQFKRYRIVPFGNHSYLECLDDKSKELPLYGSGGIRFFWDTKFDQAMVAFLDCLQQFKEEIEKGDTQFCLPYKMDKGHIEDSGTSYSIKMQFNSEEQWTKALKFMLTNLKWGVAWVSSQFAS